MHWTEKRHAIANLGMALRADGWSLLGWKDDQSDAMTDYWDPESWAGVARRNESFVVVNVHDFKYAWGDIAQIALAGAIHANPPHKTWHVERAGRILGSGVGIEACYRPNAHTEPDKRRQAEGIARLVERIDMLAGNR